MNACDEQIEKWAQKLPELCTINDLIEAGVIPHRQMMNYYRRLKKGPGYIRLSSRKIYYPRAGIIQWIQENTYAGETPVKSSPKIQSLPV